MSARAFLIRPLDSLFFRGGRPFNQDDEGMADVSSVFPPFPGVLSGAFRAAVARGEGWREGAERSWADGPGGDARKALLGDGPCDLGRLGFSAPIVLRAVEEGGKVVGHEPLFGVPRHLLGRKADPGDLRYLWPGTESLQTDQGSVRLLKMGPDTLRGAEPLAKHLITGKGLEKLLHGLWPLPDGCLVGQESLWKPERRIGLERDAGRRTAKHGMLYAATHVRLARGVGLGLLVDEEAPEHSWEPQPLAPLGGFQRMVEIEEIGAPWPMPRSLTREELPRRDGEVRYLVVLTAPMPSSELGPGWRRPGGALARELPGRVVAACLDRPQWIGGWSDGFGRTDRGPLPLRPCLAAGSVWFLEATPQELEAAASFPPQALGGETVRRQGFGACLIGRWPGDGETR